MTNTNNDAHTSTNVCGKITAAHRSEIIYDNQTLWAEKITQDKKKQIHINKCRCKCLIYFTEYTMNTRQSSQSPIGLTATLFFKELVLLICYCKYCIFNILFSQTCFDSSESASQLFKNCLCTEKIVAMSHCLIIIFLNPRAA